MKLFIQKKASKTNNPSSLLIHQKSVTNQQGITSIGKNLQETIPLIVERLSTISKNPKQK